MSSNDRLMLQQTFPQALKSFAGIEQAIDAKGLDPILRHLVKLRVSQINGCAFCVTMHSEEARADGETNERLDRVVVWRSVADFTAPERAALAWAEALTELDQRTDLTDLHSELLRHFSEAEIGTLTVVVAMINVWNRLQVATHADLFPAAAPAAAAA